VKESGAIVNALARVGVRARDELGEKRVRFVTAIGDAGERRVLARDAHPGMPQYQHQEAGLAPSEAELRDGFDAFFGGQSQNSSARPPLRPPSRLPPPPRPVMRAPDPP
jgi:hypothetical protein